MKKMILSLCVLAALTISCKVHNKDSNRLNKNELRLKITNELETILLKDQGIRELLNNSITPERKEQLVTEMKITAIDLEGSKKYNLMKEIDSTNLKTVESIIAKNGYPSKLIEGEKANKAVFYVLQHSQKIDQYLPLIRKAVKNGNLTKVSLALMEDRNLMYKGIEQLYGTQIKGKANKKGEWIYFIWPIKNAEFVNIRRKKAGFKQTIEEYTKEMDVEFKLYKLNEIDEL